MIAKLTPEMSLEERLAVQNSNNKFLHTYYIDYPIEQGTDGIWTYEKMASGKAVCYAKIKQTLSLNDLYAGIIYYKNTSITFPAGLFIDAPNVWLEILSGGGLFVKSANTISKDEVKYYLGEFTNSPKNRTLDIMIEARGHWKLPEE